MPLVWSGMLVGVALAASTLVAVVYTWRTANRVGARLIAGIRVLSRRPGYASR